MFLMLSKPNKPAQMKMLKSHPFFSKIGIIGHLVIIKIKAEQLELSQE